jgi:hypothetical protein
MSYAQFCYETTAKWPEVDLEWRDARGRQGTSITAKHREEFFARMETILAHGWDIITITIADLRNTSFIVHLKHLSPRMPCPFPDMPSL